MVTLEELEKEGLLEGMDMEPDMDGTKEPESSVRLKIPQDISPKELSSLKKQLRDAGAQSFEVWYVDRGTAAQNMELFGKYLPSARPADSRIPLHLPKELSKEAFTELKNSLFEAGARYEKAVIPAEKSRNGVETTVWNWYVNPNHVESLEPFQPYMGDRTIKFRLPENLTKEEEWRIGKELLDAGASYQKYHVPADKSRDGKEHEGRNWFVNPSKVESMEPFKPYIGRKMPDRQRGAEERDDGGKGSVILQKDTGGYQTRQMTAAERSADGGAR